MDTDAMVGQHIATWKDPPPPAYVKFGPGQTDEMPVLWAQRGLTWLKDNRPAVFADMMLAVLGVERAKRNRGK